MKKMNDQYYTLWLWVVTVGCQCMNPSMELENGSQI